MAIVGENITIASAARAVASLGRYALPRPIVVDHPDEYVAALNPFLLPLNPALDVDHFQAKHVFDVIERFEGPLDEEHIAELAAKKKISSLSVLRPLAPFHTISRSLCSKTRTVQ